MTGTILGTWLGGNELYKEGLIIRATALKWTEQFYLACEAWKKFLWVKSHLSAGKTSFLTLCQCSPLTLVKREYKPKMPRGGMGGEEGGQARKKYMTFIVALSFLMPLPITSCVLWYKKVQRSKRLKEKRWMDNLFNVKTGEAKQHA